MFPQGSPNLQKTLAEYRNPHTPHGSTQACTSIYLVGDALVGDVVHERRIGEREKNTREHKGEPSIFELGTGRVQRERKRERERERERERQTDRDLRARQVVSRPLGGAWLLPNTRGRDAMPLNDIPAGFGAIIPFLGVSLKQSLTRRRVRISELSAMGGLVRGRMISEYKGEGKDFRVQRKRKRERETEREREREGESANGVAGVVRCSVGKMRSDPAARSRRQQPPPARSRGGRRSRRGAIHTHRYEKIRKNIRRTPRNTERY